MSQPKRHLHRDYHTTFCGRDASYISMTYDKSEANCGACLKAAEAQRAKTSVKASPASVRSPKP